MKIKYLSLFKTIKLETIIKNSIQALLQRGRNMMILVEGDLSIGNYKDSFQDESFDNLKA